MEEHWLWRYRDVVRTGIPERVENYQQDVDRWFDVHFSRVDERGKFVAIIFKDITDQRRAELALREREERQVFLLRLSDALRGEEDEQQVEQRTLQMLAEHLSADRAYITTSDYEAGFTEVPAEVRRADLPPLAGIFHHSEYPESSQAVNEGTIVINDVGRDPNLSELNRQSFAAWRIGAVVGFGLRKGVSDIFWTLAVAMEEPRQWTSGDVLLLEQAAERTWSAMQRARSDLELRNSEARFQQFANASAAGLWIRDAETLDMEFASSAVGRVYGVATDELLGDVRRWAAMIVPEDRDTALQHLEAAQHGTPAVHEFRIHRPDDGFRWIRNTDFPLFDAAGRVERVGGIAEDVTDTRRLTEHQGVLLHELQHRVRNIMGMIRSMANRTAAGSSDVEDYRQRLDSRLLALSRVQALLTRGANTGGSLRHLIETEVHAQAHHAGQLELTGPDLTLSPKAVEVLTLAFHELATNALKYGALSVGTGVVRVTWQTVDRDGVPWLMLDWAESGAPARRASTRRGFGSELIEARIPYELKGYGRVEISEDGARCRLEFPVVDVESTLQTDAPTPTRIFGGSLDMSGAPDLSGQRVLVVEDDYYMASDMETALRSAGAEVIGPSPNEATTRQLLDPEAPTAAVVDLNLGGGGPKFAMARLLQERGIPFVFLTGYDPDVIPPEFASVLRLQKPLPLRHVVEAIAELMSTHGV